MRNLLFAHHLENAFESLLSHRLRTLLTVLGVTIGVASVTAILSLTEGATKLVQDQVDQLSGNVGVIRSGAEITNEAESLTRTQTNYATATLTEDDLAALEELPHLEAIAPLMNIRTTLKSNDPGSTSKSHLVVGTTPDLAKINNLTLGSGQFMDEISNANAAVLGEQLSVDLFGTEQSIGKTFTIRDQTFTVIGVLNMTNQPVNFSSIDFDNSALISLESAKSFTQNIAQIQQINLRADSPSNITPMMQAAEEALLTTHKGERDFTVLASDAIAEPTSQLFRTLAALSTIIAGISLVVGGIGIMNIMLVSVAERTREIGIRKSVGASNRHIIWQYIIESLAISITGGVLGYLLGLFAAFLLGMVLPFTPQLSFEVAGIALGLALLTGVIFGLYPAIKAARKDPIMSLRQTH